MLLPLLPRPCCVCSGPRQLSLPQRPSSRTSRHLHRHLRRTHGGASPRTLETPALNRAARWVFPKSSDSFFLKKKTIWRQWQRHGAPAMPAQRVHVPSRFPRLGPATPGPTALCQATSTPPRTCHGAGTLCRACLHFRRRMRPADGYRQPRGPVKGGPATWLRAVRFFAHGVARRAPQTSTPGCHHVHYPSLTCRLPGEYIAPLHSPQRRLLGAKEEERRRRRRRMRRRAR